MKRVLLTIAVALLIPSILMAAGPVTLGVYFDGVLSYTPVAPSEFFSATLYMVFNGNEYEVTGIEYSLTTPNDPGHTQFLILGYAYPPNHSLTFGDAWAGQSVTYWPPMTGYPHGYDLMVTYECMTTVPCEQMWDYPIVVSPHPETGALRGTYTPLNDFFQITGLTSFLCPQEVGTVEESWGAIKSMYR